MENLPLLLLVSQSTIYTAYIDNHLSTDYHIISVKDPAAAEEKLQFGGIDVIIIDEKAPNLELYEFLKQIRAKKAYLETPIIVITSHLKKSETNKILAAGATDFLNVPLEEEELFQRLETSKRYHSTHKKMMSLRSTLNALTPKTSNSSLQAKDILDEGVLMAIKNAQNEHEHLTLLMIELSKIEQKLIDEMRRLIRDQDFLAPLSNTKFVLLLPKTSERAAVLIAENLQKALQEISKDCMISIGLVDIQEVGKTAYQNADQLLNIAAKCLLEAKKTGNKIITPTRDDLT